MRGVQANDGPGLEQRSRRVIEQIQRQKKVVERRDGNIVVGIGVDSLKVVVLFRKRNAYRILKARSNDGQPISKKFSSTVNN